jgi:hypothetical protein
MLSASAAILHAGSRFGSSFHRRLPLPEKGHGTNDIYSVSGRSLYILFAVAGCHKQAVVNKSLAGVPGSFAGA